MSNSRIEVLQPYYIIPVVLLINSSILIIQVLYLVPLQIMVYVDSFY